MKKLLSVLLCLVFATPAMGGQSLKIGLLLIEDSVPFHVAEQEGFYQDQGVEVELVPFLSALERDSALTAGAIDGAIADPVGAILLDQGRGVLAITSLGLGETPAEGVFAILAAPGSGLKTIEDLKGVDIAVSSGTIIEYITDRLLEYHGFSPDEINTVEVKKMPIRMQMLLSGSVAAATLPEPLASIAAARGAVVLATDADVDTSLSQTVIVFTRQALAERRADIAAFFRAYDQAVKAINADPETYRPLVVETGRIPPFMADSYQIPVYPRPEPFSTSLYEQVITWLNDKGLVEAIAYEQMVSTDFMGPGKER